MPLAGESRPLENEVRRELAAMRSTHFHRTTHVDERTDTYDYGCSGLLDWAARSAHCR
jgi:hypothetical protein